MDLWDLTKLLLRRWYFAAPMLLVSVVLVFLVAQSVQPDYTAKGYVQMIPPPGSRQVEDPDAKPRPKNPWLDLGYAALANAVVLKVTEADQLEQMDAAGFSDSVTITMNERSPLLEIEVVGKTKEQATATVRELIKQINREISAAQSQYGVLREDTITTLTLNDGSNPEVESSKVKRVLVVAAAVGLLVTTAGTIALDTLLRRRARRRLGLDDGSSDPDRFEPALAGTPALRGRWGDDVGPRGQALPTLARTPALPASQPMSVSPARPVTVTMNVPSGSAEAANGQSSVPGQSDAAASTGGHVYGGESARPGSGRQADDTDTLPMPPDATIVLPLSSVPRRDDRNSRH